MLGDYNIEVFKQAVWTTVKNISYYLFLFFFGFFVCYIWAHSQREELAHRIIKLEAGEAVIKQLCNHK